MQIELSGAAYAYGKPARGKAGKLPHPPALQPVSLSLGEAEMVAVAGRSGSGKSTLLHLMKGLLKPTEGAVRFQGRDPWKERSLELFDDIGLVFQYPDHQLFAPTVFDDIAFGWRSKHGKHGGEAEKAAVMAAMERVGLDCRSFADRSPFELSGGEKRKVAIAGVLALRPKLLLLDEPTAGLDLHAREALFALLHQLRQEGTTVVWVSHQLSEVLIHATRLLWMDDGRLMRDGNPADILSEGSFLRSMDLSTPESLSLRQRLLEAGFRGLRRPWDAAALAEELLRQRQALTGTGGRT